MKQIVIGNASFYKNADCLIYRNGTVVYPKEITVYHPNNIYFELHLENVGPVFLLDKKEWFPSLPGYYPTSITEVCDVCGSGYRGHQFFQAYTKEQLESLTIEIRKLVTHFNLEFDRKSFDYNCNRNDNNSIWYYNKNAVMGREGIYTPNSISNGFEGIAPLYQLINALKSI